MCVRYLSETYEELNTILGKFTKLGRGDIAVISSYELFCVPFSSRLEFMQPNVVTLALSCCLRLLGYITLFPSRISAKAAFPCRKSLH